MKNVNNFQIAQVKPEGVAYKSVAHKKTCTEKNKWMSFSNWIL